MSEYFEKRKVLEMINILIDTYNYKPLPKNISNKMRDFYQKTIPSYLSNPKEDLFTIIGTPICKGYERIVIGDYGAYIEFSPEQAYTENFEIAPGQKYRLEERYHNTIKYIWYRAKDSMDIKIYFQMNTVDYADYRKGYYYVSVFDVFPNKIKGE